MLCRISTNSLLVQILAQELQRQAEEGLSVSSKGLAGQRQTVSKGKKSETGKDIAISKESFLRKGIYQELCFNASQLQWH